MSILPTTDSLGGDTLTQGEFKTNIEQQRQFIEDSIGTDTTNLNFYNKTETNNFTVKLTGNQNIEGVKTFTSFPVTPSSAPTTDFQVSNKKYVDDLISTVSSTFKGCSVYLGSSQTLTSTVNTKITFDIETHDANNWFDIATNRFQPTQAGYYDISAAITSLSSFTGTSMDIRLYKNGSNFKRGGAIQATISSSITLGVSATGVYMNGITDYLEIFGQLTGTNTTVAGNSNSTYFTASFVGE